VRGKFLNLYGTVWYGTVRYGTVRYDTVRYGTVRYGTCGYYEQTAVRTSKVNEIDFVE